MKPTHTLVKIFTLILMMLSLSYAKKEVLRLSIFPYLSPGKIIKQHKELAHYLENELKQPVSIITFRNIPTYIKDITERSHHLLLTASHVGRFAQVYSEYQPIAISVQDIQGYFIVKKESTLKHLNDIRGKTISMVPPFAIISQRATQDLKSEGIIVGKDITHFITKNHLHSLLACQKGKSDIAVVGNTIWNKMPSHKKENFRILRKGSKNPGFMIMGKPSLDPKLVQKIKNALFKFTSKNREKPYSLKGFKKLDQATLESLDRFMPKTVQSINSFMPKGLKKKH